MKCCWQTQEQLEIMCASVPMSVTPCMLAKRLQVRPTDDLAPGHGFSKPLQNIQRFRLSPTLRCIHRHSYAKVRMLNCFQCTSRGESNDQFRELVFTNLFSNHQSEFQDNSSNENLSSEDKHCVLCRYALLENDNTDMN